MRTARSTDAPPPTITVHNQPAAAALSMAARPSTPAMRNIREREPREQRDVAAGDRDHVIRAGRLQASHHVVVQAGAIANNDRRDDGGGAGAVRSDGGGDCASGIRAGNSGRFIGSGAISNDAHERRALHRAREGDAATRDRALLVRHAGVEVAGDTAQFRRCADPAAGTPLPGTCVPIAPRTVRSTPPRTGFAASSLRPSPDPSGRPTPRRPRAKSHQPPFATRRTEARR